MLSKVLMYIILLLLVALASSGFMLRSMKVELDGYKLRESIEANRYTKAIKSYDNAIESIVKFYDGELAEVDNFKKDTHETDCQAAYRLFRNTKY